jgi:hypothetical protein
MTELAPMGVVLEHHRRDILRISLRDAASRAGVSEPTWRRVVKGAQTTVRNIVAMAVAVGADPAEVLHMGRVDVSRESLAAILSDLRQGSGSAGPAEVASLVAEVERIRGLPLPVEARLAMLQAFISLHAEAAGVAQGGDSEANRLSVPRSDEQAV